MFVWLSCFADQAALARRDLTETLAQHLEAAPETLRLTPTSRSRLP